MRIGIDLMGSDRSPQMIFNAVLEASQQIDASHSLVVIATDSIVRELKQDHPCPVNVQFFPVSDSISMGDEPVRAVAYKKGSSLVMGVKLLKKGFLDAFISAGNTGALIASSSLHLPHLPGIKRPALLAELPTTSGSVAVLDVGGTIVCKTQHLMQFALLGAAYKRAHGSDRPKIGLLNIGIEPKKGSSTIRKTYQELEQRSVEMPSQMQFVGNVEGREIFQGKADVIVTDGFAGNILLKTTEGVASLIFDHLTQSIKSKGNDAFLKELHEWMRDFSYAEYPGALVCGVEKVVIKCHGHSSKKAIINGIKGALDLLQAKTLDKMKELLQQAT